MSWEEKLFLNQSFIFILETKFTKLKRHILEMNLQTVYTSGVFFFVFLVFVYSFVCLFLSKHWIC